MLYTNSIFLFLVSGPKAFEQTLTIAGMLLMMVIFGTFGPKTCELRSLRSEKGKKQPLPFCRDSSDLGTATCCLGPEMQP